MVIIKLPTKFSEEDRVLALVQREEVLFNVGKPVKNLKDFGASDDFFTQFGPPEGEHRRKDGVGNKLLIVHELVACEGWHSIKEQSGRGAEIPDRQWVESLIHLREEEKTSYSSRNC